MILDIHTHKLAPAFDAVVNLHETSEVLCKGQSYSVGVHPWHVDAIMSNEYIKTIEDIARRCEIVAIGECGLDRLKGGDISYQILVFRKMVELSETLKKPLIVHDVKAHDLVLDIWKDMKPNMPWVIHGFRNKLAVAKMFTDKGIYLSFGIRFNEESVKTLPRELILAETDDSDVQISDVITRLSKIRDEDMQSVVFRNVKTFLASNLCVD